MNGKAFVWMLVPALLGLLACGMELESRMPSGEEPRACNDGLDNDSDGRTDYPQDPGCQNALDPSEEDPGTTPACSDGLDNDSDGRTDFDLNGNGILDAEDDPGCASAADDSEENLQLPECGDLLDNDQDGLTDMADPDCENRNDDSESS